MSDVKDSDGEQFTDVDASDQPVDVEDAPLADDTDRFDQIGMLGKGGMGEVRLCRDRRISRFVAQKVLNTKLAKDPQSRSRFLLEARVQGQLEHPAIVPVHDLGETDDGELFFSMKCVRGMTLRQAIDALRRGQRAPEHSRRRLLTAFSSVCQAVEFAHARGVVHRDLKPENVMLGQFGEVYVLDWGIAKVMHRKDTPVSDLIDLPAERNATRAGSTLGTPRYMSPERQMGIANPSTDVYALGVILGEILEAHDDIDVPPELQAIQIKASALDAGSRYHTARELYDAIEKFLDGDRDLETRKKLSAEHAKRAEEALARAERVPAERAVAGREVGRALGLDPDNRAAVAVLMRMMTDVPETLPPAAQAEMNRRWLERQKRTQRASSFPTLMTLGILPLILWLGVRDWSLLGAYLVLAGLAAVMQYISARNYRLPTGPALVVMMAAVSVLTTSMGLLGVVPAAFAVIVIAWRMNLRRALQGFAVLLVAGFWLVLPFVLVELGLMAPTYELRDGALVLLPRMNELPPGKTYVAIILATFGALAAAVIYGKMYVNEMWRAEHRLSFQAWQLQQLVSPTDR